MAKNFIENGLYCWPKILEPSFLSFGKYVHSDQFYHLWKHKDNLARVTNVTFSPHNIDKLES